MLAIYLLFFIITFVSIPSFFLSAAWQMLRKHCSGTVAFHSPIGKHLRPGQASGKNANFHHLKKMLISPFTRNYNALATANVALLKLYVDQRITKGRLGLCSSVTCEGAV